MRYCKKCGAVLGVNDKFCSSCGENVEDNVNSENNINSNVNNNNKIFQDGDSKQFNVSFENNIDNRQTNSVIRENAINNKQVVSEINNHEKKGILNILGDIIRYFFGIILVIGNVTDLPSLSGFIGIIAGLSLMPFVFKLLKDKLNIGFNGIGIVIPVVMIFIWGISLPSEDTNIENSYNNGSISSNENEENEKDKFSEVRKLQNKWNNYYNDNNVSIVETNANTLYEYGKYYSGLTVLTSAVIEQKNSTTIKTKIDGKEDSIYYSFIFNFDDKKELSYYKKGDTVIIVGKVAESSNSITLNECHIISSGTDASNKIQELEENFEKHNNYAKALKSELSKKGELGSGYIEILDSKVIKSRGDKILLVSLLYKNIGDENEEFNYNATVKVFQNGVELNASIMKCSWYNEKYKDNADVEIQPGVSVTVNKCFLIDDTSSDVEVIVESWMFASMYDTLSATFKLK